VFATDDERIAMALGAQFGMAWEGLMTFTELERQVAQRTRQLEASNRELESFSYSVSHDLRAPLRAIEGFGRVLEDRYAPVIDDTGRGYLERVRNAAARMSELIEGLLKLSRVARGDLVPERLDLSRMAGDIVADLRTLDPHRPVTIDIAPTLVATADAAMVAKSAGKMRRTRRS